MNGNDPKLDAYDPTPPLFQCSSEVAGAAPPARARGPRGSRHEAVLDQPGREISVVLTVHNTWHGVTTS